LRKLIIQYGIPDKEDAYDIIHKQCKCTTRGLVWKALLGVREVSAEGYIALVRMGQSSFFTKINGDVDRTFSGDETFKKVVPLEARTRILNAFANEVAEKKLERSGYVQGMNAVAGMFLSCMPEPDAYECFRKMVNEVLPLYFGYMYNGSQNGCLATLATLRLVDYELYTKLKGLQNFTPVFFNQSLLGLMSVHPPLSEAMKMWDFFMAFGFGLVPISVAATFISDRGWWTSSEAKTADFKDASEINATAIIKLTLAIALRLPPDFIRLLLKHPRSFVDFSEFVDVPATPTPIPAPQKTDKSSSQEKHITMKLQGDIGDLVLGEDTEIVSK